MITHRVVVDVASVVVKVLAVSVLKSHGVLLWLPILGKSKVFAGVCFAREFHSVACVGSVSVLFACIGVGALKHMLLWQGHTQRKSSSL